MRKSLVFVFTMLIMILSGCIISKTPSTSDVTMKLGDPMTFSINVFPSATYTWSLDDTTLSNTGNSYEYTGEAGDHTLTVKANHFLGTDTWTWNIQVTNPQTVSIEGYVYIIGTSTPISEAVVSTSLDSQTTTTDSSGHFCLVTNTTSNYSDTPYAVKITASGYYTYNVVENWGDHPTKQAFYLTSAQANLSTPILELLNSMVSIPDGSFEMGSTDDEYGLAWSTTPVHTVILVGFYICAYEVTQTQYLAVMGTNPSYFQGEGHENCPVEYLSWYDAREFCTQLSTLTGRAFTLPSEAQWEYACRAGTTTLYSFGDDDGMLGDYAWFWGNTGGIGEDYGPRPIGTKLSNPWGLYDMHGNVWELCLDSCHGTFDGAPSDGSAWGIGPSISDAIMVRGGGWSDTVMYRYCRSASRADNDPNTGNGDTGFRVVEVPAEN